MGAHTYCRRRVSEMPASSTESDNNRDLASLLRQLNAFTGSGVIASRLIARCFRLLDRFLRIGNARHARVVLGYQRITALGAFRKLLGQRLLRGFHIGNARLQRRSLA